MANTTTSELMKATLPSLAWVSLGLFRFQEDGMVHANRTSPQPLASVTAGMGWTYASYFTNHILQASVPRRIEEYLAGDTRQTPGRRRNRLRFERGRLILDQPSKGILSAPHLQEMNIVQIPVQLITRQLESKQTLGRFSEALCKV
jgi:hypothetical protein